MLKHFWSSLASISSFLCVSPAFVYASTFLCIIIICTSIFTVQKMSAHSNLAQCVVQSKLDRDPMRYSWKTSRERKTSAAVITLYNRMVLYCACAVARVCFRCVVSSRAFRTTYSSFLKRLGFVMSC